MLEKLLQAAIITFLLSLLVGAGSPKRTVHNSGPAIEPLPNPLPNLALKFPTNINYSSR